MGKRGSNQGEAVGDGESGPALENPDDDHPEPYHIHPAAVAARWW